MLRALLSKRRFDGRRVGLARGQGDFLFEVLLRGLVGCSPGGVLSVGRVGRDPTRPREGSRTLILIRLDERLLGGYAGIGGSAFGILLVLSVLSALATKGPPKGHCEQLDWQPFAIPGTERARRGWDAETSGLKSRIIEEVRINEIVNLPGGGRDQLG